MEIGDQVLWKHTGHSVRILCDGEGCVLKHFSYTNEDVLHQVESGMSHEDASGLFGNIYHFEPGEDVEEPAVILASDGPPGKWLIEIEGSPVEYKDDAEYDGDGNIIKPASLHSGMIAVDESTLRKA